MNEQPPSAGNLPLIRASELGQFGFCERAWWLATVKKLPADYDASLATGVRAHARHGRQVQAAAQWRQAGLWLVGLGVLLFLAGIWLVAGG